MTHQYVLETTLSRIFKARCELSPDAAAYRFKADSEWKTIRFSEFYLDVERIAGALASKGVGKGDHVALISNTRYQWSVADMAILCIGGVTVPIAASLPVNEIRELIAHSDSKLVLVESQRLWESLSDGSSEVMSFETHWSSLMTTGESYRSENPDFFVNSISESDPNDLFTLCYTSGTTGNPKGVLLTHDNMVSVLEDCVTAFRDVIHAERETTLSFLPYSHILGRLESMAIYTFGWTACFAEGFSDLALNMREVRPTLVFTVPQLFERAHHLIQSSIGRKSSVLRKVIQKSFDICMDHIKNPSATSYAAAELARRTTLAPVLGLFGGNLKLAVCGGAPLPSVLRNHFLSLGLDIYEGYGMTETSGPVTLNSPTATRHRSVGRPLPEVALKIAPNGEILIQSRKVFRGYFKDPIETQSALQEGWLHTGDTGALDADGFLHLTGRTKDLFVTAGGRTVAPQKIEGKLMGDRFIQQAVVLGDSHPHLVALITLRQDEMIRYAAENLILFSHYSELVKHPRIQNLVRERIDRINSELSRAERIVDFTILPHPLTVEAGELTPSLRVKRSVVAEKYAPLWTRLYSNRDQHLYSISSLDSPGPTG